MEKSLGLEFPNFKDINYLIAESISSLVGSFGNDGISNMSMSSFLMNMIPYKKIKFLQPSFAGFIPQDKKYV